MCAVMNNQHDNIWRQMERKVTFSTGVTEGIWEECNRRIKKDPEYKGQDIWTIMQRRFLPYDEKPKRISEIEIYEQRVNNQQFYIIKNKRNNKFYRFNEMEFFIFNLCDGTRVLKEIALKLTEKFGIFSLIHLIAFIDKLKEENLLEGKHPKNFLIKLHLFFLQQTKKYKILKTLSRILLISIRWKNVDHIFDAMYRKARFLTEHAFTLFLLLFSLCGLYLFLTKMMSTHFADLFLFRPTGIKVLDLVLGFLMLFPILVIHEFFHALFLKRYGRQVFSMGILLQFFIFPIFYVDVTDAWLCSSKQRIMIFGSGPLSTFFFGAILTILSYFYLPSLFFLAYLCILIAIISLNPIFNTDGYEILQEITGIQNLRGKVFKCISKLDSISWFYLIFSVAYGILLIVMIFPLFMFIF